MFTPEELLEVKIFLGMLFPWDEENENLYKSISWTFTTSKGETGVANFAAQTFDDLIRLISNRKTRAGANVYACLGTQRMASIESFSTDGFPKAIRKHTNIVNFKSIALDIDVGKEKSYATTEDAYAALYDFARVTGLPDPSMTIYSGTGGLHVYWCFDKPVPFEHWVPLARGLQAAALNYGLKFDPQVTVNPAGILRVPNTFNHKLTPPAPVLMLNPEGHQYPRYGYQQMVGILGGQARQQQPGVTNVPQGNRRNSARADNFRSGIETAPPVAIEEVAINCGVISDMLDRGGDGDSEPLWNLGILAASFTTDPHAAAHALSDGDKRYTHGETEKKLLEKVNARAANPQVGWPTCESFSIHHAACATCPLFANRKTPFHFVPTVKPSSPLHDEFRPAGSDVLMPEGYWRNRADYIYTTLYGKDANPYTVELISYPITDCGIDPDTGTLLYETSVSGVPQWREINVSANMQPVAIAQALAKGHGLYVNPKYHTPIRDFVVAWVAHLQTSKRFKSQSAYGWVHGGGFAFDDKIYYEGNTQTVYRGRHNDANFKAAGDLKPWQDAMPLVYGNRALEALVASAFGAPLVELIGSTSLVLSVYSPQSGVGKTTAMTLAQSVWGHPRSGMSSLADTLNATMKRISDLKSLPIYWDELRTKDQIDKVVDLVFQVTQGKGKQRMLRDLTQAEAKTFTTILAVASNSGIVDTVYSQTEATNAGGLRVFEVCADKSRSIFNDSAARHLMIPLQENYGNAGAAYAEFLANNLTTVKAVVKKLDKAIGDELELAPDERFWGMMATVLIAGAQFANHCKLTSFDIPALRDYVIDQVRRQRGIMDTQSYATMQGSDDVTGLLQELLMMARDRHMIITETIPYMQTAGKPTPNNLVSTDPQKLHDVWIQVGDRDGRIRLACRNFDKWLRERKLVPGEIMKKLEANYFVTRSRAPIGAGVVGFDALAKIGRVWCYNLTPRKLTSSDPIRSPGSGEPS